MRNTSTILVYFSCCLFLLFFVELNAQIPTSNSNFVHSDYDYFSVEAHAKNAALSGPFLSLLSNDVIQFEFDVFTSPDEDLYYSIFHCDPFWNTDDSNPSDVIQGFTSQLVSYPENVTINAAQITDFNSWANWYNQLNYTSRAKQIKNFLIFNP
jgi:hypothetical protein